MKYQELTKRIKWFILILPWFIIYLPFNFGCVSRTNKEDTQDQIIKILLFPDSLLAIANNMLIKVSPSKAINPTQPIIVTSIWGDCHICISKFSEWGEQLQRMQLNHVQLVFISVHWAD